MNYHPDDLLRLIEEVEEQGGVHRPERCVPHTYKIQLPVPGTKRFRSEKKETTGCNNETLFLVSYDPSETVTVNSYVPKNKHGLGPVVRNEPNSTDLKAMLEREAGLAKVCAVDDSLGLWPRFAGVIEDS